MIKVDRDNMLKRLHYFATEKGIDLSKIIQDFLKSPQSCTHEFDRIAKEGYLTCKCGKNMKWSDAD